MANAEQLEILRLGVRAWNQWRASNLEITPDFSGAELSGANLSEANLRSANLRSANLFGANLSEVDLRGAELRSANLRSANLFGANLRSAKFSGADLSGAELRSADLSGANLSGANLSGAELSGANLSGANLNGAELSGANLSGANLNGANLNKTDFRSARLQNATLNNAVLTAARLWETQRAGWSIKDIICERAFWDEGSREPTEYGDGEFEKLHSEQACIELFYQGGITKFELNTLPALLHRLATLHPASGIRLKSIQEVGGGAKVSISVENAEDGVVEKINVEAQQSQAAQIALRDDSAARWEIEKRLLLDEVFPRMLASAGQHIQITGAATGVVIAGGPNASVNSRLIVNDAAAIAPLLEELTRLRAELDLPQDQEARLESAIQSVRQELRKDEPKSSVVSGGLKIAKEIAAKVIAETATKALTEHWSPLIDQITHFINAIGR
jgi:uncharacterized protein YjbI with pentapeptide repeats